MSKPLRVVEMSVYLSMSNEQRHLNKTTMATAKTQTAQETMYQEIVDQIWEMTSEDEVSSILKQTQHIENPFDRNDLRSLLSKKMTHLQNKATK